MRAILALLAVLIASPVSAGDVLRDLSAPSAALGRPLVYSIYKPDSAAHDLPVVYLLHGRNSKPADWLDMAHVAQTADRLIAEHRIPPCLIVLPDGANSWYAGPMAAAIAIDLPAEIERRFAGSPSRGQRAIAGNSMGGFGALGIALAYPERFIAAASMSGAFWTMLESETALDDAMQARVARVFDGAFGTPFARANFLKHSAAALAVALPAAIPKPALYLTAGTADFGAIQAQSADLARLLKDKGFDVESETAPGGHEWGTWERALPRALEFIARRWAR
jgi:enterochelin esterase family protein